MAKVMMTIQSRGGPPTIEALRARYGLTAEEIDPEFGVVEIDPSDGTYTVLVESTAVHKIEDSGEWTVQGPFANPKIEPFGPPETTHDEGDPF